jgi:hypothetical protein
MLYSPRAQPRTSAAVGRKFLSSFATNSASQISAFNPSPHIDFVRIVVELMQLATEDDLKPSCRGDHLGGHGPNDAQLTKQIQCKFQIQSDSLRSDRDVRPTLGQPRK